MPVIVEVWLGVLVTEPDAVIVRDCVLLRVPVLLGDVV